MTKEELSELLHSLNIAVNEGVTSEKNENAYPRVLYWDYIWEDKLSSGECYEEWTTYQISFYSKTPRHSKLIELRNRLRDWGIHPTFYHEYVEEDKVWHSYFAIEVSEDE
jgi:hypothetical protein